MDQPGAGSRGMPGVRRGRRRPRGANLLPGAGLEPIAGNLSGAGVFVEAHRPSKGPARALARPAPATLYGPATRRIPLKPAEPGCPGRPPADEPAGRHHERRGAGKRLARRSHAGPDAPGELPLPPAGTPPRARSWGPGRRRDPKAVLLAAGGVAPPGVGPSDEEKSRHGPRATPLPPCIHGLPALRSGLAVPAPCSSGRPLMARLARSLSRRLTRGRISS